MSPEVECREKSRCTRQGEMPEVWTEHQGTCLLTFSSFQFFEFSSGDGHGLEGQVESYLVLAVARVRCCIDTARYLRIKSAIACQRQRIRYLGVEPQSGYPNSLRYAGRQGVTQDDLLYP